MSDQPSITEFIEARYDEIEHERNLSSSDPFWLIRYVLADIAAKRLILEVHGNGDAWCDYCSSYDDEPDERCLTIRLLAAPFASHDDYDQTWSVP